MHYHPLGNTGLTVSVAGLGCGGNSRLGLGRGASFDECVGVARAAIDLGVNFLDTAEVYGTEEIVGAAVKAMTAPTRRPRFCERPRYAGGDWQAL